VRAAALAYRDRGWCPIPVPYRTKGPILDGWRDLRLDEQGIAAHFNGGPPMNVGVNLEASSLVDVDLDCLEALRLAPMFLPTTRSRFGRPSKRSSHWIYAVTAPEETEQFSDPDPRPGEKAMVVELRCAGVQTVFPGSTHESGEEISWDEDGEPARADGTLRRAVAELATACLLVRHWPEKGVRHNGVLAAAGFFLRGGLDVAPVTTLLTTVARDADATADLSIVRRDVAGTAAKLQAGEEVTGGPRLAALLRGDGGKVVSAIRRWLGLQGPVEPLTDVGNAALFVEQHGGSFRYCYSWRSWLHFDGRRWRRDAGDVAVRCGKETARGWFTEAAQTTDEARRKAVAKWATYANSEPGLRRMLLLAQAELAITPDQLDADGWLLNCPNGTVQLRTGHLRPHQREDFCTKMVGAPYDPAARSAVWDTFLESALPDEGAREYAQKYAGYCLTGSTREEVFVFCRGPAGGGKSTFTEGLRRTLADYASSADFESFLTKRPGDGPREDIARLAGARLVTSVETRAGQRLAEGLLKVLTGGDTLAARRVYEKTFEFSPQFKLLLASNYRPRASADDDGLWRRLRELPFPTARPRREDRDESVKAAITDPAQTGAAILRWAVEGCGRWLAEGLGEPPAVLAATDAYRQEQDVVAQFVRTACVLEAGAWIPRLEIRRGVGGVGSRGRGARSPG
jgi:putative DNA primase/helicase